MHRERSIDSLIYGIKTRTTAAKAESMVFTDPLITTGFFGRNRYNPAQKSAKRCIQTYNKFVQDHGDYDVDVKLCSYSRRQYAEVEDLLWTCPPLADSRSSI